MNDERKKLRKNIASTEGEYKWHKYSPGDGSAATADGKQAQSIANIAKDFCMVLTQLIAWYEQYCGGKA